MRALSDIGLLYESFSILTIYLYTYYCIYFYAYSLLQTIKAPMYLIQVYCSTEVHSILSISTSHLQVQLLLTHIDSLYV